MEVDASCVGYCGVDLKALCWFEGTLYWSCNRCWICLKLKRKFMHITVDAHRGLIVHSRPLSPIELPTSKISNRCHLTIDNTFASTPNTSMYRTVHGRSSSEPSNYRSVISTPSSINNGAQNSRHWSSDYSIFQHLASGLIEITQEASKEDEGLLHRAWFGVSRIGIFSVTAQKSCLKIFV